MQCNSFCFISVRARAVLKKEHLTKCFVVLKTFGLQCLLDDLVEFIERIL